MADPGGTSATFRAMSIIGERPTAVAIDDLVKPRFAPDVVEMLEAGAALGRDVELSTDALCSQAVAESGLDDFAPDPTFFERVDVLLAALGDEAGLSAFGRLTTSTQLVQLLKNRLLLTDLLRRHPEIHDIEMQRPVVIAGLPRTGTTHLHNLLAANPNLRSLPYWESLEPVPLPGEPSGPDEPDPRLDRTAAGLAFLDLAAPYFKRMHEMTVDHVHEEIQLLAIDFSSMLFETIAPMPSWRDYYLAHDQTPHYEYLRTTLKALTFLRGGDRWVLKSPQHIEQFGPLLSVFPDATVLVTHREPVAVTVSVATMIAYTARLHLDPVDPIAIGGYWADRIETMLGACVRDRALVPEAQSLDIRFDEFMADDLATVERIHRLAGEPFDPAVRASVASYRDTHPRGRHGGVEYDLAEFGLDAVERADVLGFYTERFGVA
jgi:hypothetical protein